MMTLDEIKQAWLHSSVNDEHKPLADRTFFNNIEAIRDMFGISIVCNRSSNEYYIENEDDINGSGIRNWMMNALSINNLLTESASMKNRVLFEEIPSSQKYVIPIMTAMKEEHKIRVRYKSFAKDSEDIRLLNPYCLKSFRQRWYLLASTDNNPEPHIYALDRIVELEQSCQDFAIPDDFDAESYFAPYCGYPLGSEKSCKPTVVRVKVNAHQRNYFRTLPLHHSQQELDIHDEFSIFEYFVVPNFYFKQSLISYMDSVEVLEPKGFREEFKKMIDNIHLKYNDYE